MPNGSPAPARGRRVGFLCLQLSFLDVSRKRAWRLRFAHAAASLLWLNYIPLPGRTAACPSRPQLRDAWAVPMWGWRARAHAPGLGVAGSHGGCVFHSRELPRGPRSSHTTPGVQTPLQDSTGSRSRTGAAGESGNTLRSGRQCPRCREQLSHHSRECNYSTFTSEKLLQT